MLHFSSITLWFKYYLDIFPLLGNWNPFKGPLIFTVFADFFSIRENKYQRKIWNDANCKSKYLQKFEKETMIREYIYIYIILTFTYKCNQIQLSQYLLLRDIVDLTCCWQLLFALRFFFPLLCETMTWCHGLASAFSLDC